MKSRDQLKYLEKLKRYEKKFTEKEFGDYKMFLKRHKDEEELDSLSLAKLKELYEKYYINREKKDYGDIFKSSDSENEQQSD